MPALTGKSRALSRNIKEFMAPGKRPDNARRSSRRKTRTMRPGTAPRQETGTAGR